MLTPERRRAWLRLIRLSDAYKACFCDKSGALTPSGARVLRDLQRYSGLDRSPLKVSPLTRTVDTHATAVAIGRSEAVRRIWRMVDMNPNTHPAMKESDDE